MNGNLNRVLLHVSITISLGSFSIPGPSRILGLGQCMGYEGDKNYKGDRYNFAQFSNYLEILVA